MPRPMKLLYWFRLVLGALFLAAFTALVMGFVDGVAFLTQLQVGPAIFRFSWLAAALLLITALGGRLYCALLCPLGLLQDLAGVLFFWRKNRPQPRLLLLRKGLGLLVWSLVLIGGWTLPLVLLDPFTLWSRFAGFIWLPIVVLAFTLWRKRLFCNSLCPVGALLACTSAHAPFGLHFTSKCVKCGKCVKACPTGCLDPKTATFDNGRCIRCFACGATCPVNAIAFGRNPKFRLPERRSLLTSGSLLTGAVVAGAVMRHFPQPIRHNTAMVNFFYCRACEGTPCGRCAKVCPAGAIILHPREDIPVSIPEIIPERCIGCHACEHVCPADPKAIEFTSEDFEL